MSRPFTVFAALVLLLVAAGHAAWLATNAQVTLNGVPVPPWAPITGVVLPLLAALGIAIDGWRQPRAVPVPTVFRPSTSRDMGDAATRGGHLFTVHSGKHYKATISLNFFEQMASNQMIAQKFEEAGFTQVEVTGEGDTRVAVGLWPSADASAQMPSQVSSAVEIA